MSKYPNIDLLNPGRGDGINIFFAGSGFNYNLAYCCGVRKRLLSWHANAKDELYGYMNKCDGPSFGIMDSGAFTVWNKGGEINVYTYGIKLLKYLEVFDIAANLDVIPGKQGMAASDITTQMTDDAASQGWKNFSVLCDIMRLNGRFDFAERIMPIYHQGESLDWLKKMVDYGCDYIGISPSNDYHTNQRMFWLDDVFNYLSTLPTLPMTHGYAVTSPVLMEMYPWMSVDSASWVQAGGLGTVFTPFGNVTLSDRPEIMGRRDSWDGSLWSPEMRDKISEYFKSIGFTVEQLRERYHDRWRANAIYLIQYEKDYVYKSRPKEGSLFGS